MTLTGGSPSGGVAEVIAQLHSMRLGKAAELVETAVPETLAYYAFPEEHWRRIRTNNPLARIMREIRRRTRVVGSGRVPSAVCSTTGLAHTFVRYFSISRREPISCQQACAPP